jgi:hypothetical protein
MLERDSTSEMRQGGYFEFDAEKAFGKYFADRFAQFGAGGNRRDEPAFLLGGFECFLPFRWRCGRASPEKLDVVVKDAMIIAELK